MARPFSRQHSTTNLSIASKQSTTRATAQEVYDQIYGAAQTPANVTSALQRIYEPNASTYENPLLTATSRELLMDICHVAQRWMEVDMPTPASLLAGLFASRSREPREPWFRVLRVWGEVGDICEAESFDGHRKSIVEHTIHFLILPGLHSGRAGRQQHQQQQHPQQHPHLPAASESSLDVVSPSHLYTLPHFQRSSQPSLVMPGTRMALPSPLHLELRVLSRLEFNGERVTYHRDYWDVKDLMALVPGAKLAQYVGTRLAARALASAGHFLSWIKGHHVDPEELIQRNTHSADNSLGLLGIDIRHTP